MAGEDGRLLRALGVLMDRAATYPEAMKEYARDAGEEDLNQEWIITPWDTWERNPNYIGEPRPHPDCIEDS